MNRQEAEEAYEKELVNMMSQKELAELIKCREALERIAEALEYILEETNEESEKKKYFYKTPHF